MRINLTRADIAALMALLRVGTSAGNGLASASSGERIGTTKVAELIHVTQSTIRSWMATGGPKRNPFPRPSKHLGRCEWELTAIDAWMRREEAVRSHRRKNEP